MDELMCNVCNKWIHKNIPVYRCVSAYEKNTHSGNGCHICHNCFNQAADFADAKAFKELFGVSLRNWLNKPAHCSIYAGKLEKL